MFTLFLRLIFIYIFTLGATRVMGKRQIGELQLSELVSAFFLSELATYIVTDLNIPLTFAVIPIVTIIILEIITSFLSTKIPLVRKAIDNPPSFLIQKGRLLQKEMEKNRVTLGELLSQIRQAGVGDIREVNYAILESNGKISVIPKDNCQCATPEDLNLQVEQKGLSHAVISDGKVDTLTLRILQKDENWLKKQLKKENLKDASAVLLLTVDDAGNVYLARKEQK